MLELSFRFSSYRARGDRGVYLFKYLTSIVFPQVLDSTSGEAAMLIIFEAIRESLSRQSNQEAPLIVTVGSR